MIAPPDKKSDRVVQFLLALLTGYQRWLSPWLGRQCRFHPTCSQYAKEVLQYHGVLRGGLLAGARLCRCQPFCQGGLDPAPTRFTLRSLLNPSCNDQELPHGSQT